MLDFCGQHNITADVEVISIQQVNEAYERMFKSDVKYRFSIDMALAEVLTSSSERKTICKKTNLEKIMWKSQPTAGRQAKDASTEPGSGCFRSCSLSLH
jgi:hypothetical protein